MRNNNEYSFSDGFGAGGGSGAPIIAPVFATAPASAPYAAPIIGGNGGGLFGGNDGGGLLGGIIAASVLGNGLGGRRDGNDCDNNGSAAFSAAILGKLGSIEGAVPLAALGVQNALLEQTAAVTSQINQVGLAQLAATSGLKDTVQNSTLALLQSSSSQGEQTRALITQLNTDNLNRLLTVSDLDRRDERSFARSREIEVNVTQNVNQQQAQAQQANQFNTLFGVISNLANDLQYVKQTQSNINFGVQGTAGQNATASNTKVS